MKYKVGDIIRQYTPDRRVYWRGVVEFIGPRTEIPILFKGEYWIKWDNGSSNRVDEDRIEFDPQYLREEKLNKLLK